jgi:aryl-alcohol dehydrogenase-like predicted oxidoreductase
MNYRTLGADGPQVSELGFGAWGLGGTAGTTETGGTGRPPRGWAGTDEAESVRALQTALRRGVTFIDTALGYGAGRSERIVGETVRAHPETAFVATKVPPKNGAFPAPPGLHADEVFPGDWIRTCVHKSLENLGLESIDLLQLHVWRDEWVEQGSWRQALEQLRSEGTIRMAGVSVNNHDPASAMRVVASGAIGAAQIIYNVFDQSPEDEFYAACEHHGVGVIARVPFDEGALTGTITPDTQFGEGDFRIGYFRGDRLRQVDERVTAILADLAIDRAQMADLALRFVLSHPAVSTVIPGMRSTRNVERNLRAAATGPLDSDQLARLKTHRWVKDFYI